MPPNEIHYQVDRILFGEEFTNVHNFMDRAWDDLGPFHRIVGHRNRDLLLIRRSMGKKAFRSACVHRRIDRGIIQILTIPGKHKRISRSEKNKEMKKEEIEKCPSCNGSGIVGEIVGMICPSCKGTGYRDH